MSGTEQNQKVEDPDYSPETDHFSDPKAAETASKELAKKMGLSEEDLKALWAKS